MIKSSRLIAIISGLLFLVSSIAMKVTPRNTVGIAILTIIFTISFCVFLICMIDVMSKTKYEKLKGLKVLFGALLLIGITSIILLHSDQNHIGMEVALNITEIIGAIFVSCFICSKDL